MCNKSLTSCYNSNRIDRLLNQSAKNTETSSIVMNNYTNQISRAKSVLHNWKTRGLSLTGKVCVVNTLVASLFVYYMQVLPTMTEEMFSTINNIISEFIWNGRKAKIPLRTLQLPKNFGGFNLVNLRERDVAVKISWIKYLVQDTNLANLVYSFTSAPELKHLIWKCNLNVQDVKFLITKEANNFWYDTLSAWAKRNYTNKPKDEMIWFNSNLRVDGQPVWWLNCYKQGLIYISQLFPTGQRISAHDALNLYHLDFMKLCAILSAIPRDSLKISQAQDIPPASTSPPPQDFYSKIIMKKSVASFVYHTRPLELDNIQAKCNWWSQTLQECVSKESFYSYSRSVFAITNHPRVRAFYYRQLHNALVFNCHLYRWGILHDNLCTFCQLQPETMTHLFVDGDHVQPLWEEVRRMTNKRFKNTELTFPTKNILFNCVHPQKKHFANFICLLTKMFIYRQRCLKLQISPVDLRCYINNIENCEKYIAIKNNHLGKHEKKWAHKAC